MGDDPDLGQDRTGDGGGGNGADAGDTDEGGADDAGQLPIDGGAACDLEAPFGLPTFVEGTHDGCVTEGCYEASPSLTGDELVIYFERQQRLYTATRTERSAAFGTPLPVLGLQGAVARSPSISDDDLTLYFQQMTTRPYKLWRVIRTQVGFSFSGLSRIDVQGAAGSEDDDPAITSDGLYFSTQLGTFLEDGGGDHAPPTLYRAAPAAAGEFGAAAALTALASNARDTAPALTADGLRIYFTSTRDGGAGTEDIWTARRTSRDAAWTDVHPVHELNTEFNEVMGTVSRDGCRVYFTSNWSNASLVYMAARP